MNVGVIGCGNICGIYFKTAARLDDICITACADLMSERAIAKAEEFGCRAMSVDELLADPSIDIVLNLTIPKAHTEVALAAIAAGKHVYNEKPLGITREDGQAILAAARAKGVRVGCAPDTVLGGGHQTCRKLINDGWIGQPVAATAFMTCPGHESWHPDPEFYYKAGGGPMFDMGPYYLTALVTMMGPVARVNGMARATYPTRTITSAPKYGTVVTVDVPTHVVGTLEFASGAIGTIITSFDVYGANLPRIEVYGTEGSLNVPDPNGFGGTPRLKHLRNDWADVPLVYGYAENSRGLGVADMAHAIATGRPHRANGDLAYHVLDVMHAIHDAAREGKTVDVQSTVEQPPVFPLGLRDGQIG